MDTVSYLHCHACGKQVSTGFVPVPTDTPDKGLIVRAWIECPECIEKRSTLKGLRYGVVSDDNVHGGDGWTIIDRRRGLTTGGWFADRIAAERTADVLNEKPTGAADDRR